MSAIAAVILAAGEAKRMGSPKQLLRIDGETLVRRAARAAIDAGFSPVIVVVGAHREAVETQLASLGVVIAHNDRWADGIGGSIVRGARELTTIAPHADATAILLADQPLIGAAALRQLRSAFESAAKPVCCAEFAGTIGPPVIVARSQFDALQQLSPDRGAKQLWIDAPSSAVVRILLDAAAIDLDTPADWQRFSSQPVA